MTPKEYLRQAYRLEQAIQSDLDEVTRLRELAAGIKAAGFEEHHNPNRPTEPPFVKALDKALDLERKISADAGRLVELREQIRTLIDGLDNPEEQRLLRRRYLHHCKWEEIAEEMHYSLRWIYKLHGRALASFDAAMAERVQCRSS